MIDNIEKILKMVKRIHLVGVCGVSMSALAVLLMKNGYIVSGSDLNDGETADFLRNAGVEVFIGHSGENIGNAELVVNTAAAKGDNPEIISAKERNIPVFERAVLLGAVMKNYACPIGVAGTHGKTTTTAMVSSILLSAKKDPTIMIGGNFPLIGGNFRIGGGDYFVFESCEYVDSFLNFYPKISIVLNIDEDHLDYFFDIFHIISSFRNYCNNTSANGVLILNKEDENCVKILKEYKGKALSYGLLEGDFHIKNLRTENKFPVFDVYGPTGFYANIKLKVPGTHNIKNAVASCAAAYSAGIDGETAAKGLADFKGVGRRFEYIGEFEGFTVIDDYAHHPTEISATLKTAKDMGYNKVWCIFQPHTYTRTKALLNEFASALSLADRVILADVYSAREKDIYGVSSKDVADLISGGVYINSFEEIVKYIRLNAKEGDLVITMGAGDIDKVARNLIVKSAE